jgi:hypothetical protein
MSATSVQIVFDHLHDRGAGDMESLATQLHPDVVHQGVSEELVCRGRDEVVARITATGGGGAGIDHLELVDAGDRVIVGLAGPRFREVPWLQGQLFIVFTVRDGLIVRMDDHRTRAEAFTAAGAPIADWV